VPDYDRLFNTFAAFGVAAGSVRFNDPPPPPPPPPVLPRGLGQSGTGGEGSRITQQELITIPEDSSLSELAALHGITTDELLAANPQITDPDVIFAGDTLVLPVGVQARSSSSWAVGPSPQTSVVESLGLPSFPTPPPLKPGDGSGPHGVKERDSFEDQLDEARYALFLAGADAADGLGLDNASRHMRHYLSNSGEAIQVDPDKMVGDLPGFRAKVEEMIQDKLQGEINDRIEAEYNGEPIDFLLTTDWGDYYATKSESLDWFFGIGGFHYAVGAAVDVHVGQDGNPIVEVQHQTHVFDRYNWDEGKSVLFGLIRDEYVGHLHEVGVAHEFEVYGSSEIRSFSYVYSGPESSISVDVGGVGD
jgi:hypothetical protein